MTFEQRLNLVADRYRTLGYKVVVRPGPEELPPFAKDFKVEILASGPDGSILVSAKKNPLELEADPNLPRYAEVTSQQPGWRFDLFVLGPDSQPLPLTHQVKELQEDEILKYLDTIQAMLRAGFIEQALVAAWAPLEAAMRRRLRAQGEEAGWGTSPRTMLNELYSAGAISTGVLRELEGLFSLRSAMAHGFSVPIAADARGVQILVDTARRLLAEPQPAKQTA